MQEIVFDSSTARETLKTLPEQAAVFALYGAEAKDEPYVGRTPNLRRRLGRLLLPSASHPKRLQLASRVRRIAWSTTGSDFESLLAQFSLLSTVFGEERALERMHLRAPLFVRFFGGNRFPRLAVTTRPSKREAGWAYGPFPSRAAADRYVDETLKLFQLRRCTEELVPDPKHPGCVYSEMKMCLAPCFQGCTDERYGEEAHAVEQFLTSRGESRLVQLRTERDEASAQLAFEHAAEIHQQVQRVEAVQGLASELVRPWNQLRAVILQISAQPDEVSVFLFENGQLRGPAAYSTLGMRIQNEHSGSTSLFLQPMAVAPVPEAPEEDGAAECFTEKPKKEAHGKSARGVLEARFEAALEELRAACAADSAEARQAHLALLKRWFYRPEARRAGEVFFPNAEEQWPVKNILRGIGRIAAQGLFGVSPEEAPTAP